MDGYMSTWMTGWIHNILWIVPDIIKFTYYHCTSIDYSVLCEWSKEGMDKWMNE